MELAPGQTCLLLSYQCAIDAMSSRCFPSYALRRRPRPWGSDQMELLMISAALAEGWAVSVPDHEGPKGRRMNPVTESDGIRSERVGLSPATPIRPATPAAGWLARGPPSLRGEYAPDPDTRRRAGITRVGDLGHTFRRLMALFLPVCHVAVRRNTATPPGLRSSTLTTKDVSCWSNWR